MKTITIKLTRASSKTGPFTIKDQFGNTIAESVSKDILIRGISYSVNDNVTIVTLASEGKCSVEKSKPLSTITLKEYVQTVFQTINSACLWRHLTSITVYNSYYGNVEPYIIEYPFAYAYQDQILQNIQDYTKVYQYNPDGTGVFSYTDKIELDNVWFNKAVLYNGQQSSGVLVLEPKPQNNMSAYLSYPKYATDSKAILYTKSDNFYQFNTFWSVVKDKTKQLFVTSCESLSIDRLVNQDNMDYSSRSFNKAPLRAKELKVRYILDNRSDVHLVSQFIVAPSQISYK